MNDKYSIKELSELCGISKQAVSKRIKTLQIKTEKRGGMIWVSGQDAEKLVNVVSTTNRQLATKDRQQDDNRQPEEQPQDVGNSVKTEGETPTEGSQPTTSNQQPDTASNQPEDDDHQPDTTNRIPPTANQQLIDELRRQLEEKQREIERLQAALELEQNNSRLALESLRAAQTLQARSQGLIPDLTIEEQDGSRVEKRSFWQRIFGRRS